MDLTPPFGIGFLTTKKGNLMENSPIGTGAPENLIEIKKSVLGFDPRIFNTQIQMANAFAKSGILPAALRNKPNDIVIILQLALELNLPPMQAINGINVIQGKPTISPQLMLAMIYKTYPETILQIKEDNESRTVTVRIARNKDDSFHESTWNVSKATSMGLIGKDNWQKQFMTMCKWRAVAEVVRTKFPHVIMGLYTSEELDAKDQYVYNDLGEIVGDKKEEKFKEAVKTGPADSAPVETKKKVDPMSEFIKIGINLCGKDQARWEYLKNRTGYDKDVKDQDYWFKKLNEIKKLKKEDIDNGIVIDDVFNEEIPF